MGRVWLAGLFGLLLLTQSAFAAEHSCYCAPRPANSNLLFNPTPSAYPASAFAYRSDWPSTRSYYSGGQVIFYTERFYDYQGRNRNFDWTYRQFQSQKSGFGYR